MSDRTTEEHRGTPLLRAARHAALHAPKDPPRTLLWRPDSRVLRWLVVILSLMLAVGFSGGSIAIHLNLLHTAASPAWLLGLLQCLPLLITARWPLVAWRLAAIGLFTGVLLNARQDFFWPWPVTSFLAMVIMLFAVGVSYERRTSAGVGAVTIAGLLVPAVVIARMDLWFGVILAGLVTMALIFGDAVGGRYSAEASLAEQAELRRRDLARQAVLEERARIARELHDVVAHHMSVIAMQSEAAPYKIPDLPDAAKETFAIVRDAAREALTETRRVVGLLRSEDEAAERLPQPGLSRLEDLLSGARQAGLRVESRIVGMPRAVAAGVDLSAYRIVQESLSNAARYAPGSRVLVEVRYNDAALRITISDDGPRSAPLESGGGHGLVGMRERVTMLGGTFSAGPVPAGTTAVATAATAVAGGDADRDAAVSGAGERRGHGLGNGGGHGSGAASGARTGPNGGNGAGGGTGTGRGQERHGQPGPDAPAQGWTVRAELPY